MDSLELEDCALNQICGPLNHSVGFLHCFCGVRKIKCVLSASYIRTLETLDMFSKKRVI